MEPNIVESRMGIILEGRVRGTVRNRADGSVEVHAAGSASAVAAFRTALRRGPPGASVTALRELLSEHDLPPDFQVIG
jgi:acylphosphatase